jgi:hydroxylysine kinase
MTDDEAVDLARERFGIEGRPTRFATEKDDTFRIAPASGPRFILKVANPIEDIPEIDLQVQVLDHVAARAPDLPVPRVIPNDKGERHFNYLDRAGQRRQVRMMSYLEGQPLSEVPSTASGGPRSANCWRGSASHWRISAIRRIPGLSHGTSRTC